MALHSTPRAADRTLVQALDLPEIKTLVAQYLDLDQLASAARVCRDWNTSFSPHLHALRYAAVLCWKDRWDRSRIDAIEQNAHLVRYLDIVEDPEEFSLDWFSHLTELFFRTYHLEDSLQERFLSLIRCNISLRAVTVRITTTMRFCSTAWLLFHLHARISRAWSLPHPTGTITKQISF